MLLAVAAGCGGGGEQPQPVRPSEASVEGKIALEGTDDASGVVVSVGSSETVTDSSGTFTLAGAPTGDQTLVADKSGYQSKSRTVEIESGQILDVGEITLKQTNRGPTIDGMSLASSKLEPEGSTTLTVEASDPNGDDLSYTYEATGNFSVSKKKDSTNQAMVTAPDSFGASGTIGVAVEDGNGESATATVDVATITNKPPTLQDLRATPTTLQPGETGALVVSAEDPDDDTLSYEWSGPEAWSISDTQSVRTEVTAPDGFDAEGTFEVTITDEHGSSTTGSITLRTGSNEAPQLLGVEASPPQIEPGETIALQASASDPEGGELGYQWNAPQAWSLDSPQSASTDLTAPDSYDARARITVVVEDEAGATAEGSVLVSTPTNNGPRISGLSASPQTVDRGGTVEATVNASDPNGDDLTVSWSTASGWSLQKNPNNPFQATITAPSKPGQTGVLEVTVSDGSGGTATASTTISTAPNRMPTINQTSAGRTELDRGATTMVSVDASDADGDSLSYQWNVPSKDWSITSGAKKPRAMVKAPDSYGETGIAEVRVTDGFGQAASAQLLLKTVRNGAPTIDKLTADDATLAAGGMTTIRSVVSDPNGDSIDYQWSAPTQGWSIVQGGDTNRPQIQVTAPDAYGQTGVVKLTVSDGFGGSDADQVTVKTEANQPPRIGQLVTNTSEVKRGGTIQAETFASDGNGDSLNYNWSISSGKWSVQPNNNDPAEATVQATPEPGRAAILEIEVTDGYGGRDVAKTTVRTEPNTAPTITRPKTDLKIGDSNNPSPISASRLWKYQVRAQDANDDELTYSFAKNPSGATIGTKSGLIEWRPQTGQKGTNEFVVEVSDGYAKVQRRITLKVSQFNLQVTDATRSAKNDGLAFGDFDGDGKSDVVYVDRRNSRSADIELVYSGGDRFARTQTFTWSNRADGCVSPAVGDVDGDKDLDIVVVCDRGRSNDDDDLSYYTWKNDGAGAFSPGPRGYFNLNDAFIAADVELGNLDNDSDLELVAVGDESLVLADNNGSGKFSKSDQWHDSCHQWYQVEIGQFDKDGRNEIATSYRDNCPNYGYVEIRDVHGSVNLGNRLDRKRVEGRYDDQIEALGVGELSGDKLDDVVVVEDDNDNVSIYRNTGNGNLTRTVRSNFGSPPYYQRSHPVDFGDLNGDGNTDVVIGTRANYRFQVYLGDGSAGVAARRQIQIPNNQYNGDVSGVHVTDWNGDQDEDVVFGTTSGYTGIAY
jgi:hypothetical protein